MRKPIKLQPRKYLLNPVQRDASPMRGETHFGQPTTAVDRRFQTYRDALSANIHRRQMKLYHAHAPSDWLRRRLAKLDLDAEHALQIINYHHERAAAPRFLAQV